MGSSGNAGSIGRLGFGVWGLGFRGLGILGCSGFMDDRVWVRA